MYIGGLFVSKTLGESARVNCNLMYPEGFFLLLFDDPGMKMSSHPQLISNIIKTMYKENQII